MTRADKMRPPGHSGPWGYDKPAEPTTLTLPEVADALKRHGVVLGATVRVKVSSGKIFIGTVERISIEKNRITIKWLNASKSRWSLMFTLDCLEGRADFNLVVYTNP